MVLTSKKGSVFDLTIIMFVFLSVVLTGLMMMTVVDAIFSSPGISLGFKNATGQQVNNSAGSAAMRAAGHFTQSSDSSTDNMIVAFFFLMHIGIIVLAALTPANIIFMFVALIMVMVNIMIGYAVQSMSTPLFAGFMYSLPMSKWLLDHIIGIELCYAVILIIIMFMSARGFSGGTG